MTDTGSPLLPELLETHQEQIRHRHRRRRSGRFRWFRRLKRRISRYNVGVAIIMIAGFAAAVLMGALILSMNARSQVDSSWQGLSRIWSAVNNKPGTELTLADFDRLRAGVRDLISSLGSARRQTSFLRPLTFASEDLEVQLKALDAAHEIALAANDMLTGAQPVLFFLTGGEESESVTTQLSSAERVVELLRLGRGRFLSAGQHLDTAQDMLDRLGLATISADLLVTVDGLVDYHRQLTDINGMLIDSPDLLTDALGVVDTKTYLILSQNSDELRPSGGYVSTYGWMTVRAGRIVEYNYSPTTETSPNPPPAALASEVELPDWWIKYQDPIYAAWDGSWYADFPSTARMAAWYYDQGGNPHSPVDGVIAMDIVGFEYLLQALESVYVPEYDLTVTPETFRTAVYDIRAAGEGHKRFIAAVYRQILNDWQAVDRDKSVEMRGAALRALQEKHIMIYFPGHDALNQAMDVFGWSGAQKAGTLNDYLMVAEANLGNKANRSVIRQLTYDVEILPDGALQSRLSVAYDYSARVAETDPAVAPEHGDINYRSLVQVFVPANSTLTGTTNLRGEPVVVAWPEHMSFVTYARIDYNHSERYQFSYTTPVLVEQVGPYQRYRLVLQKQPGMLSEWANVQVALPPGASAVFTSPQPAASYSLEQPILEFRVELLTDKEIEIVYTQ